MYSEVQQSTISLPLQLNLMSSAICVCLQMVTGHVDARATSKSRSLREFDLEEEHRKLQQSFTTGEDFKVVRIQRPDELPAKDQKTP
jgi:hypothetical protein